MRTFNFFIKKKLAECGETDLKYIQNNNVGIKKLKLKVHLYANPLLFGTYPETVILADIGIGEQFNPWIKTMPARWKYSHTSVPTKIA